MPALGVISVPGGRGLRISLLLLIAAALATAASGSVPTPKALSRSIETDGATRAAQALSEQQFEAILSRAERGDAHWLRAIAAWRPGTDDGRAEGIDEALSDALQTNPAEVLTLINAYPDLPRPMWLCEDRAIEPSQAAHARFMRRATGAVQAVRAPSLRLIRDQCLAALRPVQVLAGAAFEKFVARSDAICPTIGVRHITPGDLDQKQQSFEESLAPDARKRLASINTADKRCASRNGLSCLTTATLAAVETSKLLASFSRFVCSHWSP